MKLVSYVDMFSKDINDQIETAIELDIDNIILSYTDEDVLVTSLSLDELKSLSVKLRKTKVDIIIVDPKIDSYNLDTDFLEVLEEYEKAFIVARELRASSVIFNLPEINDIFNEFQLLSDQLNRLGTLAKSYNKDVLIKQGLNKNSVLTYIFNHIKMRELKLLFEPHQIYLNNESNLVAYRTLKDYFNTIVVRDLDSLNNPELIGYGRVDLLDLFKRMGRDKFRGNVILDWSFNAFLEEDVKKASLLTKLLRRTSERDKYLKGYGLRIFPDEEERVPTVLEIYKSQINALKIIFGIKD